ncbi:MAG TPA: hypothetical protein VHG71_05580, partial [Verrucomicrobiae bacterium]|nr:hypothetical protein [Verrucomicrobiae bacterium]
VAMRLTGGALPPLSDNPLFAADKLSQFRDSPLYFGWFNTKVFFDVLSHIPPPEPNPNAPSPMPQIPWDKVLNASGLTGLKTATFVYRETREGEQLDSSLAVPEASRQGILKMIAASPKDANPPAFVPATAIKFWRWRMDGQNSWNTLQKMLGDISPTYLSWLNSILDIANASAQQQDPNFDVRKNFLGNLGDDWISYQTVPNGTSLAALSAPPSIFLFAVSNPDQTVLAIKNIAALSARGSDSPVRDFLGKKIYTIPLPRRTIGTNTPATQSLYFCASSGYIAVTTDNSILEAFLRSAQNPVKPLREIPGLADAAQRVGGAGNGLFGYQNQREAMRSAFSILKTTGSNASGLPFGGAGKGLREWFDFSLLPDFDAVAKYFNFSVYAGNVTTDGIYFKFFVPRPPQLN